MKSSVVLLTSTALALSGLGLAAGATGSTPTRSATEKVPTTGVTATLVKRDGVPSHLVKRGTLTDAQTRRLARDLNTLSAAPDTAFPCPYDRGLSEVAHFTASGGRSWTMRIGSCGEFLVQMQADGKRQPTLESSNALLRDLRTDFATMRPQTEHVPSTVRTVRIGYSVVARPGSSKSVHLTESQAAALVHDYNQLRREPAHQVHCEAVGGPVYTVRFTGKHHTWVAREAICTNITVTRDGSTLPTLLPGKAYDQAVRADLKADSPK